MIVQKMCKNTTLICLAGLMVLVRPVDAIIRNSPENIMRVSQCVENDANCHSDKKMNSPLSSHGENPEKEVLWIETIKEVPRIFRIHNLATRDECEHLIRLGVEKGLKVRVGSKVGYGSICDFVVWRRTGCAYNSVWHKPASPKQL
jgi:hypothetical protein